MIVDLRHQLQIVNALADRDAELVGVDHAGKGLGGNLAGGCFGEEIGVVTEHDTAEHRRPAKQLGVRQAGCGVFLGRYDIDAAGGANLR